MKKLARRTLRASTYIPGDEVPVDSRLHILDCAARLFRTQGYAATTLRNIADAAGMRAASLYHHFASKEQIVIEVLNRGVLSVFHEVRNSVEALGEDASSGALVTAAVIAHLRSLLELHDYTSANTRIFGQIPERVRRATLAPRVQYERFWARLLQRCAQRGDFPARPDLHLFRLFLIGAMNGALEWYQPKGRHKVEEIARELAGVFLRGAGARAAH